MKNNVISRYAVVGTSAEATSFCRLGAGNQRGSHGQARFIPGLSVSASEMVRNSAAVASEAANIATHADEPASAWSDVGWVKRLTDRKPYGVGSDMLPIPVNHTIGRSTCHQTGT